MCLSLLTLAVLHTLFLQHLLGEALAFKISLTPLVMYLLGRLFPGCISQLNCLLSTTNCLPHSHCARSEEIILLASPKLSNFLKTNSFLTSYSSLRTAGSVFYPCSSWLRPYIELHRFETVCKLLWRWTIGGVNAQNLTRQSFERFPLWFVSF